MLPTAYVALGSNLGRREQTVLRAVRALGDAGAARVVALSSLYESAAEDIPGAPPFVNAVVQVVPLLEPLDLLERCKAIEAELGRSGGHRQSREIDLDLVCYGPRVLTGRELTLPHPRFQRRAFVLIPLREVDAGFVCPRTGRRIDELVAQLPPESRVTRVSGRAWVMRS